MKLSEAFHILNTARPPRPAFEIFLACGFQPLHFQTLLAAHTQNALADHAVRMRTGLFGDLLGSLSAAAGSDVAAVVVEWADLDLRLGLRQAGGWETEQLADILESASRKCSLLRQALSEACRVVPVRLCLPTLALPPMAPPAGWQQSTFQAELALLVRELEAWAVREPGIQVVNSQRLDEISPLSGRLDAASEIATGFPYRIAHADSVAGLLVRLIAPPVPLKGIITDLDDTLWSGLAGELGPDGVHWDLAGKAQEHGLYQQLLASLADAGVLIAAASKNDPAVVERAFARPDLILKAEYVFPMRISWGAKSHAIREILEAWNIGADSVVYVDDSPMELEEVRLAHPQMECLRFPKGNPAEVLALLAHLRDRFGKASVSQEDRLRLQSLRTRADVASPSSLHEASEDFLAGLESVVTLSFGTDPADPRPLELINKTNQFNLNGRRLTESEWARVISRPGGFTLVVSYRDRMGPLGKIAVMTGTADNGQVKVDHWVMSCRAFSRRIEHQCLEAMYQRFGFQAITFAYTATGRNGVLKGFLDTLDPGIATTSELDRETFQQRCPALYHKKELVEWTTSTIA